MSLSHSSCVKPGCHLFHHLLSLICIGAISLLIFRTNSGIRLNTVVQAGPLLLGRRLRENGSNDHQADAEHGIVFIVWGVCAYVTDERRWR